MSNNTHPYRFPWQPPKVSPTPLKFDWFKFWERVAFAGFFCHFLTALAILASIPILPSPSGDWFRQIAFLFFIVFGGLVVFAVEKAEDWINCLKAEEAKEQWNGCLP
ncbi:MAG: hypothetical protein E6R04_07895 [Spirochaetes bacterium]|nr:MAG: hypothetical protein E6R04_07895 [Spirochaetota bacterium]